jgi:hypothetical protein
LTFLTSPKKELPSLNIKRRMSLQVFDLKDRSPAWAKALFLSVFLRFVQVQRYSLALGTSDCHPPVVTVRPD